jgi:hypothetical protein
MGEVAAGQAGIGGPGGFGAGEEGGKLFERVFGEAAVGGDFTPKNRQKRGFIAGFVEL